MLPLAQLVNVPSTESLKVLGVIGGGLLLVAGWIVGDHRRGTQRFGF